MTMADDLADLANPFDPVEQFRHECEVLTVARWETDGQRADFLVLVEKHRGKDAEQRLRRDVWDQIRGEHGETGSDGPDDLPGMRA